MKKPMQSTSERVNAGQHPCPKRLEPGERVLAAVLCVHLCFLPWPLGAMHFRAQATSCFLSVLGFGAALVPCTFGSGETRVRRQTLVNLPLFWVACAGVLYVVVQALNPNFRYVENGLRWWLVPHGNVRFLPTSIEAPFAESNAWRMAISYVDLMLMGSSIWLGVARRRTLRLILISLVINGLALGAIEWIQRYQADDRFPLLIAQGTKYGLTSTFVSRNHAGAYFDLIVFCAIALALWEGQLSRKTHRRSSPAGVYWLCALILSAAVVGTASRGSILLLGGALLAIAGAAWRQIGQFGTWSLNKPTVAIALLFCGLAVFSLLSVDFSVTKHRFSELWNQGFREVDVTSRASIRHATIAMWQDHGIRGIGAGAFRYLFTAYAPKYPDIYQNGEIFWEHAHCDWLEIPTELGIGGTVIIVALGTGVAGVYLRAGFWRNPLPTALVVGTLQTLAHALLDFPFACPAIAATWIAMIVGGAKWLQLNPSSKRGGQVATVFVTDRIGRG